MPSPAAFAAGAQAAGGLIKGLFGKTKTKIKRKPKTAAIGAALDADQKNLKGDMSQLRDAGDSAYADISGRVGGLGSVYDRSMDLYDEYTPEGRQFRRSQAAIGQYGDALRAANRDAIDSTTRRFNQQQALMGAGGSMSPFMAAMMANQRGAMNRGVEARIGALNLGNIQRFQDIGLNDPSRRFGLFSAYSGARQVPMGVLGRRNALTNQRLMGSLAAENAGTNTMIQKKDNWANKLGSGLQTVGSAVGGLQQANTNQALTNAYMDRMGYQQPANTWGNLFKPQGLQRTDDWERLNPEG